MFCLGPYMNTTFLAILGFLRMNYSLNLVLAILFNELIYRKIADIELFDKCLFLADNIAASAHVICVPYHAVTIIYFQNFDIS